MSHVEQRENLHVEHRRSVSDTPTDSEKADSEKADSEKADSEKVILLLRRMFTEAREQVPAYGSFLESHGISPDFCIQSFADFTSLPIMTKANYFHKYDLPKRCRFGRHEACSAVAFSSGSTGEPTLWPRTATDEEEVARRFEQVFRDSFCAHTRSTLAVITFALGNWVGGIYSTLCCRLLAQKGYPITVVTPGNNPEEIFRAVRSLSPLYSQTVLLGYPPFLKEVIDKGITQGIPWSSYSLGLITAGEIFSERWRSLVCSRAGIQEPVFGTASLYGTADSGVLGTETPLTIIIRRWLEDRPGAATDLFGDDRLPSLFQYDPFSRFFEVEEGELLLSAPSWHPAIRYRIGDQGGAYAFTDLLSRLKTLGCDPFALLTQTGLDWEQRISTEPFLYLFGRRQLAVSYYGANIFPEIIAFALADTFVAEHVTGRFVIEVKEDGDCNCILAVSVELVSDHIAGQALVDRIQEGIVRVLRDRNSEFAHYVPIERQNPEINLYPCGHSEYFPAGVKHRYIR